METSGNLFSPFDDIEFICETHDLPCIGLCSYGLCKEKTQFLCMKCIKSGKTCITKEKHELITISELFIYKPRICEFFLNFSILLL